MVIPGLINFLSLCFSPSTWYLIREIVATLWLEPEPEGPRDVIYEDSLSIIRRCLAGNPDLIWGLDEPPTHQKVVSSKRFFTRFMDSFPWMDGLKPVVSIPIKGRNLNRGLPFLEEEFPGLHNPIGPKIRLNVEGASTNKNAKTRTPSHELPSRGGERGTWQNHDGHDLDRGEIGAHTKGMFGKHF
jgi:hypothetical protein